MNAQDHQAKTIFLNALEIDAKLLSADARILAIQHRNFLVLRGAPKSHCAVPTR